MDQSASDNSGHRKSVATGPKTSLEGIQVQAARKLHSPSLVDEQSLSVSDSNIKINNNISKGSINRR